MRKFVFLVVIVLSLSFSTAFSQYYDWFYAVENGDLITIKSFIDEGVNVNIVNNNGVTALMWASTNGHTETIDFLIEQGADVLDVKMCHLCLDPILLLESLLNQWFYNS